MMKFCRWVLFEVKWYEALLFIISLWLVLLTYYLASEGLL